MKEIELSLKISGDFITSFVRQRVLEGHWRDALDLLINDVTNVNYEIAFDILSCRARLTGNDGRLVRIDNEDYTEEWKKEDEQYRKDLKYVFGHVLETLNGEYYEAYCFVQGWCSHDMMDCKKGVRRAVEDQSIEYEKQLSRAPNRKGTEYLGHRRSSHYLDNRKTDVVYEAKDFDKFYNGYIGFRKLTDPPIFVEFSKSWKEALEKTPHNKIDKRGYKEWYGD